MPESLGNIFAAHGVPGGKKMSPQQPSSRASGADHTRTANIRLNPDFHPLFSAETGDEFLARLERGLSGLAANDIWFTRYMASNIAELAKVRRSGCTKKSKAKSFDKAVTFCMQLEQDFRSGRILERSAIAYVGQKLKELFDS